MPDNAICDIYSENKYEYLVEYRGNIIEDMENVDYACAYIINEKLAIVSVLDDRIEELQKEVPSILLVNYRSMFVVEGVNGNNTSNISAVKVNPYLNLTGSGVLIGIADTGIDYINKEFIREDDTTRIEAIWDQTINYHEEANRSKSIDHNKVYGGKIFFEADINEAIKASKEGKNPYDIVPTKDDIGHGTAMASIAGARGYDKDVQGIAQDCNFVIVKLRQSASYIKELRENRIKEVPVYDNGTIVAGIEYLKQYAIYRQKPMVIISAIGSTDHSHDGSDLFSRFVNEISSLKGIVVVSGCGNEGAAAGHASGVINNKGEIIEKDLNIPREMKSLNFRIWVTRPNKMALAVIAPSGQDSNFSEPKINEEEDYKFIYENTELKVKYLMPDIVTGLEVIILNFRNIKPGIWKLKLKGTYIVKGRFDIWLPPHATLPPDTLFIEPDPYQTITTAGGAIKAISIGFYNQNNKSIMAESGRGFPLYGGIKPDVAAPGVDINAVAPGNGKTAINGATAAAAITAGVCALIIQWGVVKGNDTDMYSAKLISYITSGADRSIKVKYPDQSIGFGLLDLEGIFNKLAGIYLFNRFDTYKEIYAGSFFIRIPNRMEVNIIEKEI